MRWAEARAAERAGVKDAELRFKGKWVAPGFIQIRGAKQTVHLLFFMKEGTQKKHSGPRQDNTKCTREQEYAPPAELPEGTTSLFTDGSAMYDKGAKAWVSAGFGFAAVSDGTGPEHDDGVLRWECQGPVDHGDFNGAIRHPISLTNNVAELVAFIHALRWARTVDTSICLRHDSKYAALVSCGVYKGKKNKALVAIAREEWKLTAAHKKKASKGLWIRHVKGHSGNEWNDVADKH